MWYNKRIYAVYRGVVSMSEPLIPGGYYIKARCIKNSVIAHSPPYVREIWNYLLREANHSDKKYNGFIIKRGQLFRSYKQIRDDLSWNVGCRIERYNENQMKRGMKHLMKHTMIELTKEPRGNVITICKYEYYQNPKNYERTNERTSGEPTNEPGANQWRLSINKNDKEVKNDKNDKKKNKKSFVEDSHEFRLASLLFDSIRELKPDYKQPNLQVWAKEIDLMIRLDKRKPDVIRDVIIWCQDEKCWWHDKILSTKNLKKHFDQLEIKKNEVRRHEKGGQSPAFERKLCATESKYGETIDA